MEQQKPQMKYFFIQNDIIDKWLRASTPFL